MVYAFGYHLTPDLKGLSMETPGAASPLPDLLVEIERLKKQVAELEAEKEQSSSTQQDFKTLVENTPDIISRHGRDFRHTYVNPAIESVTGLPPAAFVGKTHEDLGMPPEKVAQWRAAHRQVFETGQPVTVEFDFPTPQGVRYFQSRLAPEFGPDGKVEAILNIARDITEIKLAEQQLRSSHDRFEISQEKLRQSQEQLLQSRKLESIGRLAGGIAHDFNNLLTAISGYSDLMLLGLSEDDPMWSDLQEILKATDRAALLTHQLLAFSRRQVLQPKIINLNSVITDMRRMLDRLITENIELNTSLDPGLKLVMADPGQFGQVILNLSVNSRDAMPNGGKLLIETTNIYLDDEVVQFKQFDVKPGHYVRLAISDSGVGMDAATQSHVFEPFFTTKEQGKGTGLGLATAYGIIKQSGGNISIYSEKGVGTTVMIYLPALETADKPGFSIKPAMPNIMRGTETVLLVEDEDMIRHLASRALSEKGYAVLAAGNGLEALELLESYQGPLDLVLTDVIMPKMGGRALIEKISDTRPGLKVVFISGYTDWMVEHQGLLEPGQAFMQKPFTTSLLLRKVRQVLDDLL
jgi:PAS domain S-box-containing protein